MRGWLVSNAFVRDAEYEELLASFETAAKREGVELVRRTNVELAPLVGGDDLCAHAPDFVLFWCKDIQLARMLEASGLRLFNRAESIEATDDKAATASVLERAGIPQPRSVPVPRSDVGASWAETGFAEAVAASLGLPVVVKEVRGSFGKEVHLANNVCELVELLDALSGRACVVQRFVGSSAGRDVRVQVVGGRVVGALLRQSASGDFRANINRGGSYERWDATPNQRRVAVASCAALGLDFAGVDLLFGDDEALVCEVNSNAHSIPEMRECCGVDVAGEIVRHIARSLQLDGARSSLLPPAHLRPGATSFGVARGGVG